MKIKPSVLTLGVAALAGGAVYMMSQSDKILELVPGGKYRITSILRGTPETDWSGISDELSQLVPNHTIRGKGDTRTLSYIMTPTTAVKLEAGKPLFQISSGDSYAQAILQSVEPMGRA